ncbi:hypothetical protein Are01nite_72350 [Actinoplanes regularis]|nr:hypothetical protein Are01nite_72350 [Actinoplanes regularis]
MRTWLRMRMVGDEALMFDPAPDDVLRDDVLRAAAACPVQAILVDMAAPPPVAAPATADGMDAHERDRAATTVTAAVARFVLSRRPGF